MRPSVRLLRGLIATGLVAVAYVLLAPPAVGGSTGYVVVVGKSMEPTLEHDDLVLVRKASDYRRGDVVAFRIRAGEPAAGTMVIHRIVGGSADDGFVTRGDNTDESDVWRPRPP